MNKRTHIEETREKRRIIFRKPDESIKLITFAEWEALHSDLPNYKKLELLTPCKDETHYYRLRSDPNVRIDPDTNMIWRHPKGKR